MFTPSPDSTTLATPSRSDYFARASLADLALAVGNARVLLAVGRVEHADLILREVGRELLSRCDRSGVAIFDQDSESADA